MPRQGDQATAETRALRAFRGIAGRLHAATGASRTTIRVDCARLDLILDAVAAECRDEGVRALSGRLTPDARNAAAPRWLRENRRTFVMADCLNPWAPEVAPEDYVIKDYGIRAEMVAGVFRGDDLIGLVSVHYAKGTREWTDEEVAMIERACDEVRVILDELEGL